MPLSQSIGFGSLCLPKRFPRMIHVASTAIEEVAYDAAQRHLTIRFIHGGRYTYLDVPARVARGLLAAASHGRYFHDHIRDRYAFLH